GLFDNFIINGFIGSGAAAMRIDDFNGNNFDHTGLGFIRGGTVGCSGDGTPVSRMDIVPPDVRSWGKEYKEYFLCWLVLLYFHLVSLLFGPVVLGFFKPPLKNSSPI